MAALADMSWRDFQRAVRAQARELGIPAFGTFELTPLCNFNCKMCYVHLTPERMHELGRLRTAEEWLDMARQARDAGMVGVTLTGGEVLTRPDFEEIYTGIVEMGLFVSVLSNGSLIDERIVDLFRRMPPSFMRFTLYGASNETYERLCGTSDGFDRVMRGLRLLKEAGVSYNLSMTETNLNVGDFDEVERIARELGTSLIATGTLVGAVRGATNDVRDLRVDQVRLPGDRRSSGTPAQTSATPSRKAEDGPFATCGSYRSSFWLDWNGDMDLCSFMSSCKVRPFEDGFAVAWKNLLEKLELLRLPASCSSCGLLRYCSFCPGIVEAETGSPERKADVLCESARILGRWCEKSEKGVVGDDHQEEGVCFASGEGLCD